MKALIPSLLLFSFASGANAQIGWNLDQCRSHYGHEMPYEGESDGNKLFTHSVQGIRLQILESFSPQGRVHSVSYMYLNDPNLKSFPRTVINELIEASAPDRDWTGTKRADEDGETWTSVDGSITAKEYTTGHGHWVYAIDLH
jgi:hypothetical protein